MTISAVFFDLAGVLYNDNVLIDGAQQAIAECRQASLTLRFVTNTATQSRQQILSKVARLGIDIADEELFTAPDAAAAYIHHHQLTPFALVHDNIRSQFPQTGQPNSVVLGDARDQLNYSNLNKAFRLLMQGYPLIAIGNNQYFMDKEGLSLDTGAFTQALCWASGAAPIIMGKPSAAFFAEVVASVGLAADQCLMIGDDVFGDVEGARQAGLEACLVRTGKYQLNDENRLNPTAKVIGSVKDVMVLVNAN